MEPEILIVYPDKCNNCGDCETACIESRSTLTSMGLPCIRIMGEKSSTDESDGDFFFPVACKQCEKPPCLDICPREAIYREEKTGRVLINSKKCIGCGMCASACPFGAMKIDGKRGKSYKCDLCAGDPQCVKVCTTRALEYKAVEELRYPNLYNAANKMTCLTRFQY